MKLSIFVDTKEPREMINNLASLGLDINVTALDVGDYSPGENVFVERKSGQDLVRSLADGRLFEQMQRLVESSRMPILIVEDLEMAFQSPEWQIRKKQIFGALSYLATRLSITVLPTSSIAETAILLERLCSWFQEEKEDPLLLSRGVKRTMSLNQKQAYLLQGLPRIGSKMCNLLLEKFSTPIAVFNAFMETQVIYTRTGGIKGIRGPLEKIQGIGPKTVLLVKEVLEGYQEDP